MITYFEFGASATKKLCQMACCAGISNEELVGRALALYNITHKLAGKKNTIIVKNPDTQEEQEIVF